MLEMLGLGKQTINVKDVSSSNISGVTEVVLRADELYSLSKKNYQSVVPRFFTRKKN